MSQYMKLIPSFLAKILICCLKVYFLSVVIPSNKTSSIKFIFDMCLRWNVSPRNMKWNFPGLAFKKFNLNQFKILFVSKIIFLLTFKVLSSVKLQIPDCSIVMNILSINILNKSEPNTDPWEIPRLIFDHLDLK